MNKPVRYEPVYPPAWDVDEMQSVDDDYEEVPRGLEPSKPSQ